MFINSISGFNPSFKQSKIQDNVSLKYILPAALIMAAAPMQTEAEYGRDISNKFSRWNYELFLQKARSYEVQNKLSKDLGLDYSAFFVSEIMKLQTITLDAGHGGVIPGTKYPVTGTKYKDPETKKTYYEKDINPSIALKVKKYLEQFGAKVIMTRESDEYASLTDRAIIAQKNNSDIFVSIHADSNPVKKVKGSTIYTYQPELQEGENELRKVNNPKDNKLLAEKMNISVSKIKENESRGIWGNDFRVLREVNVQRTKNQKIPAAVLVETGFLSNPEEAKRILSDDYQDELAKSIARGIIEYSAEKAPSNVKEEIMAQEEILKKTDKATRCTSRSDYSNPGI